MLKKRCHFLGLSDDPDTAMAFPSPENCCHRAVPVEQVSLNYQHTHCFTVAHRNCPVLLSSITTSLPPEISASAVKKSRKRTAVWGVVVALMVVVGIFLLFGGWEWAGANEWFNESTPVQPTATLAILDVPLTFPGIPTNKVVSATPTRTPQPTLTPTDTPALSPTPKPKRTKPSATEENGPEASPTQQPPPSATSAPICNPPANWVIYYIQPGDTLTKIAAAVGVSLNELQTANCLAGTTIYSGQRLYVPQLPSVSATANPTPTNSLSPKATNSPAPTVTPSATNTPVPSATLTPSATNTQEVKIITPTNTPQPTDTPLPPTNTPNPTPIPPTEES